MEAAYTPDFALEVQGVEGSCPAGEAYARQQIAANAIPVLTCEGPCPIWPSSKLMDDVPETRGQGAGPAHV